MNSTTGIADPTSATPTFDLGPSLFAMYPEYLTDPAILICPSSTKAAETVKNMKVNGQYCLSGVLPSNKCASAVDNSYVYLGWTMDKYAYVTPSALGNLSVIQTLMTQFASGTPSTAQPTDMNAGLPQLVGTINALVPQLLSAMGAASGPAKAAAMSGVVNSDVTMPAGWEGLGNGGGNTVYHLREGIERFLITDINNPGSANVAQSGLPIMFDLVAIDTASFNHIPGGSNVLFMDGHVEFSKYSVQGTGVANSLVANTIGMMAVDL
jgi:prepilin-type processing-associated H-X9-DG protein